MSVDQLEQKLKVMGATDLETLEGVDGKYNFVRLFWNGSMLAIPLSDGEAMTRIYALENLIDEINRQIQNGNPHDPQYTRSNPRQPWKPEAQAA